MVKVLKHSAFKKNKKEQKPETKTDFFQGTTACIAKLGQVKQNNE